MSRPNSSLLVIAFLIAQPSAIGRARQAPDNNTVEDALHGYILTSRHSTFPTHDAASTATPADPATDLLNGPEDCSEGRTLVVDNGRLVASLRATSTGFCRGHR